MDAVIVLLAGYFPWIGEVMKRPWLLNLSLFAGMLFFAGLMVFAFYRGKVSTSAKWRAIYRRVAKSCVVLLLVTFLIWAFIVLNHVLRW